MKRDWFFYYQLVRVITLCGTALAGVIICIILSVFLISCKTQYVPVESTHTEHHWHTDSVKQIDSVLREKQTTIRELDSAAMAEYGIRLRNAERAFLVQTSEFEKQIKELMKSKSDTIIKTDSVAVPIPVERKLNRWEQIKMDFGAVAIGVSLLTVIIAVVMLIRWIRKTLYKV